MKIMENLVLIQKLCTANFQQIINCIFQDSILNNEKNKK